MSEINAIVAKQKRMIDEAYELISSLESKESEQLSPEVENELTRIFKSAINP